MNLDFLDLPRTDSADMVHARARDEDRRVCETNFKSDGENVDCGRRYLPSAKAAASHVVPWMECVRFLQ